MHNPANKQTKSSADADKPARRV